MQHVELFSDEMQGVEVHHVELCSVELCNAVLCGAALDCELHTPSYITPQVRRNFIHNLCLPSS